MKPSQIRKLIICIVGLGSIAAARYGFNLEGSEQFWIDAILSLLTAAGVYIAPNESA